MSIDPDFNRTVPSNEYTTASAERAEGRLIDQSSNSVVFSSCLLSQVSADFGTEDRFSKTTRSLLQKNAGAACLINEMKDQALLGCVTLSIRSLRTFYRLLSSKFSANILAQTYVTLSVDIRMTLTDSQ